MGGNVKVTIMRLNIVDLQCDKCCKKVKKLLCKFPQIRDRVYDEKNNTVTITVVCCSPEKIRDKLCCKGRGSITSIEFVEPPPPPKPKPADKEPVKEPKEKSKEPEKLMVIPVCPPPIVISISVCCGRPVYECLCEDNTSACTIM